MVYTIWKKNQMNNNALFLGNILLQKCPYIVPRGTYSELLLRTFVACAVCDLIIGQKYKIFSYIFVFCIENS